jgi:hypothetical protein
MLFFEVFPNTAFSSLRIQQNWIGLEGFDNMNGGKVLQELFIIHL